MSQLRFAVCVKEHCTFIVNGAGVSRKKVT